MVADDKAKYIGNNLACSLPKVWRGKFLNIVIPSTNVVYTMVPNHVAKENKCKAAVACADRRANGDWLDHPAAVMAPNRANERNAAVLCRRGVIQGSLLAPSSLLMAPPPDTEACSSRCKDPCVYESFLDGWLQRRRLLRPVVAARRCKQSANGRPRQQRTIHQVA